MTRVEKVLEELKREQQRQRVRAEQHYRAAEGFWQQEGREQAAEFQAHVARSFTQRAEELQPEIESLEGYVQWLKRQDTYKRVLVQISERRAA